MHSWHQRQISFCGGSSHLVLRFTRGLSWRCLIGVRRHCRYCFSVLLNPMKHPFQPENQTFHSGSVEFDPVGDIFNLPSVFLACSLFQHTTFCFLCPQLSVLLVRYRNGELKSFFMVPFDFFDGCPI